MAGDYTKFTFRPGKDYSGVWKQQGRVDLDADWNEYVEIADRRWRVETVDIIGRCVVPNRTPDAFLLTSTGPAALDIGIGRIYVHGLMAENHGRPPLEYDAVFGEEVGKTRIPYKDQPYLPAPLPPPLAATPGTIDLFFLDVWQREVTCLEDPGIQEIALGGPDTATRLQTAWQVRALTNVGRHECQDRIEAWDALIAPSAARLTVSAVAPPASDDPCILSPVGGYRGLENRLYRIEVHTVGTIGGVAPAKFKWSRDNGSVASLVDAIDGTSTQMTVRRIGRDQVLRFQVGDWVEILDDHTELRQIAGHTAQITSVDEANRLITFAPAIPAAFSFDATDPARHTRARRWDQNVGVDANGLLDVVAGPIDIEDGVQVTFSGTNFKIGDFWVFAARTADASVEALTDAPPRGILHHFCRLGFMHWTARGVGRFQDCRTKWPDSGQPPPGHGEESCECCTVTVGDGVDSHGDFADIQQAIDSLGPAGGLVCLLRGVFEVREPIVLRSLRNIRIVGTGGATRVVFVGETDFPRNVIQLINCEEVRLENMFIAARRALAIVDMVACRLCRVEDCTLVNLEVQDPASAQPSGRAIAISEASHTIALRRNLLLAAKGVCGTDRSRSRRLTLVDSQLATVQAGVLLNEVEDLDIVHNRLRGLGREDLGSLLALPPPTRPSVDAFQIAVNRVFLLPSTSLTLQAAGIFVRSGNRVLIRENLIVGQIGVGVLSGIALELDDNDLFALIGVLIVHATQVRVRDCALMSQLAGIVHTGLLLDSLCDANLFLGRTGILFLSRRQFDATVGQELNSALSQFTSDVAALISNFGVIGGGGGVSDTVGLAMIVKIDRNLFMTSQDGVHKMSEVASADFSIIDNSFTGCRRFAIELQGSGVPSVPDELRGVANPRHLIQTNALNVSGPSIASGMPFTVVQDNQIECPDLAIEITAPFCEVRNNSVRGTGKKLRPDTGLIVAGRRSRSLNIGANRLVGGPCHGVLVASSTSDLRVESNEIEGMAMNGISTLDPSVQIPNAIISRNVIRRCRLGSRGARPWFSAAIAISAASDLRIVGNVVEMNDSEITDTSVIAFLAGIYVEDASGVEIDTNQVHDNFLSAAAGVITVAIACLRVDGTVAATGNSVRTANGTAMLITGRADGVVSAQRVAGTGDSLFPFVSIRTGLSTQFTNNIVIERRGIGARFFEALVAIASSRVVAVGNILETRTRGTALESSGDVAINGNNVTAQDRAIVVTGTRGVISANVVTSGIVAPGTVLQVNNV